jgi:hypothetical protein
VDGHEGPVNGPWELISRVVRDALTSNIKTTRLCALMIPAIMLAYYLNQLR